MKLPLSSNMKIWIPGCGTRHAILYGLRFKDAQIIASDISERSLRISKNLARKLRLSNISFLKEDILKTSYFSEFDYISCYGVLMSMPEPLEGLKILRRALKKEGAVEIMVYNKKHRYPLNTFQEIFKLLTTSTNGKDAKLKMAYRLVKAIISSKRCRPLNRYLKEDLKALKLFREDLPAFADCLIHPRETSYDIFELFSLIKKGGFSFINWFYPDLWDISNYIKDPVLVGRIKELPPLVQYQLVYLIAGQDSPMFEFYLQPDDLPVEARRCDLEEEIFLEIIPRRYKPGYKYKVLKNRIVSRARQRLLGRREGRLMISSGRQEYYILPEIIKDLLPLCDGKTTIREILFKLCRSCGISFKRYKKDLIGLFRKLFSSQTRLLVVERCPPCTS
jgi:hypothetical protein